MRKGTRRPEVYIVLIEAKDEGGRKRAWLFGNSKIVRSQFLSCCSKVHGEERESEQSILWNKIWVWWACWKFSRSFHTSQYLISLSYLSTFRNHPIMVLRFRLHYSTNSFPFTSLLRFPLLSLAPLSLAIFLLFSHRSPYSRTASNSGNNLYNQEFCSQVRWTCSYRLCTLHSTYSAIHSRLPSITRRYWDLSHRRCCCKGLTLPSTSPLHSFPLPHSR